MFPNQSVVNDLKQWISPQYVDSFSRGTLRDDWVSKEPFTQGVLANFFAPDVLKEIRTTCDNAFVERSHGIGLAAHADWYWGAFNSPSVIRFLYGSSFRVFLNTLADGDLTFKPSMYPQYNVFHPGSKGVPMHTDVSEENVHTVTLIQMTRGYKPGGGGELQFFGRANTGSLETVRTIPPIENTFIFFNVSAKSLHRVADMVGPWTRENIAIDWYSRERS